MDAIELLEEQHRDVEKLFERISGAGPDKQALFNELADLVSIHVAIEERHFYPAVRARRTEDILLESLSEHLAIKRALVDLIIVPARSERFDAKLGVLKEEVRRHLQQERTDLFPKVRNLLGKDLLEAIGQEMIATIADLLDRPLPPRAEIPARVPTEPPLMKRGGAADLIINIVAFVTAPLRLIARLARSVTELRGPRAPVRQSQ